MNFSHRFCPVETQQIATTIGVGCWVWVFLVECRVKSPRTIECKKIKNKRKEKYFFMYESFGKFNQNSCELEWMMEHGTRTDDYDRKSEHRKKNFIYVGVLFS
jgi:hypothetical protein